MDSERNNEEEHRPMEESVEKEKTENSQNSGQEKEKVELPEDIENREHMKTDQQQNDANMNQSEETEPVIKEEKETEVQIAQKEEEKHDEPEIKEKAETQTQMPSELTETQQKEDDKEKEPLVEEEEPSTDQETEQLPEETKKQTEKIESEEISNEKAKEETVPVKQEESEKTPSSLKEEELVGEIDRLMAKVETTEITMEPLKKVFIVVAFFYGALGTLISLIQIALILNGSSIRLFFYEELDAAVSKVIPLGIYSLLVTNLIVLGLLIFSAYLDSKRIEK